MNWESRDKSSPTCPDMTMKTRRSRLCSRLDRLHRAKRKKTHMNRRKKMVMGIQVGIWISILSAKEEATVTSNGTVKVNWLT